MEKENSSRLAFLDVARGLAALLVLAEHGLNWAWPSFDEWRHANGFLVGRIGVALFLVISGFIIPHSIQQGGSNARFWLRRCFRLFPLYWLCIVLAFLSMLMGIPCTKVSPDDSATWLMNLTMLQGFFGYEHVIGLFWTLQMELVIYAVCSLLLALRLFKYARLLVGLGAVAYLLMGTVIARRLWLPLVPNEQLLYAAPLVGFLIHGLLNRQGSRLGSIVLLAAVILIPLRVHLYNFRWLLHEHAVRFLADYCLHYLGAYLLFFGMVSVRNLRMPRVGCWLGRISYSVYLSHALVGCALLNRGLPPWLFLLLMLGSTLALSELLFRFVEAPGIALGRRAERWLFPPRPPAAAQGAPVAQPTPQRRAA